MKCLNCTQLFTFEQAVLILFTYVKTRLNLPSYATKNNPTAEWHYWHDALGSRNFIEVYLFINQWLWETLLQKWIKVQMVSSNKRILIKEKNWKQYILQQMAPANARGILTFTNKFIGAIHKNDRILRNAFVRPLTKPIRSQLTSVLLTQIKEENRAKITVSFDQCTLKKSYQRK